MGWPWLPPQRLEEGWDISVMPNKVKRLCETGTILKPPSLTLLPFLRFGVCSWPPLLQLLPDPAVSGTVPPSHCQCSVLPDLPSTQPRHPGSWEWACVQEVKQLLSIGVHWADGELEGLEEMTHLYQGAQLPSLLNRWTSILFSGLIWCFKINWKGWTGSFHSCGT